MNAAIEELALRDLVLLRQEEELEQQFLNASLGALRGEIKARFGVRAGPRALRPGVTRPFAAQYTTAMSVGYLFGALHAQKLVDSQSSIIQLAGEKFDVPFAEAEDFLRAQVAINRDEFDGLKAGLKFRAFTMAKVGQEDLLRRIQGLYVEQLNSGASRADLLQNMDSLLEGAGIGVERPYWLETHYRNNMMAAYNAGRWAQIEDNDLVELLAYNSIMDGHTTKLCRALDGTVLPKRDKHWQTIHPTNHHSCRAVVVPVSREQAKLRGIHPDKLNMRELYKDPQIKREHQFKAHPADVLDVVPAAMAERAQKYGQWPDIMKFAAKANRGFMKRRLAALGKTTLGKHTIDHVLDARPHLRGVVDQAIATLAGHEEAWLSATKDTDQGVRQSMLMIRWITPDLAMVLPTRMTGGIKTFYTLTREEFNKRVKQHAWVKI